MDKRQRHTVELATHAQARAGVSPREEPPSTCHSPRPRARVCGWALARLAPGLSRGPERVWPARQCRGALSRLWRARAQRGGQQARGVGRETPSLWSWRAAAVADSCAARGRHRGGLSPTRRLGALRLRRWSAHSFGPHGASGGRRLPAPHSSDGTVGGRAWAMGTARAGRVAHHGGGPQERADDGPGGARAGRLAARRLSWTSGGGQGQPAPSQHDREAHRRYAVSGSPDTVGLAPLEPPGAVSPRADRSGRAGLPSPLAPRTALAIVAERSAWRVHQDHKSRDDLLGAGGAHAAHGAAICARPSETAYRGAEEKTGAKSPHTCPPFSGVG